MRIFYKFFVIVILLLIPSNSFSNKKKEFTVAELIQSSELALKTLNRNSDLKNFKKFLASCRAILIFPEVYEGGFLFGAKGGNGILLIKKADNFTGPFFYSIGGLSFGLQAGAKSGKVVMTIMTHRGLKSILKERVKLGVDVDAVMISDGIGYSAESTLRLADIYSFSDNKGLFLGTSIEGSYLQPRNDLNKIVHNAELNAEDILRNNSYKKESESLKKIILRITNDSKN